MSLMGWGEFHPTNFANFSKRTKLFFGALATKWPITRAALVQRAANAIRFVANSLVASLVSMAAQVRNAPLAWLAVGVFSLCFAVGASFLGRADFVDVAWQNVKTQHQSQFVTLKTNAGETLPGFVVFSKDLGLGSDNQWWVITGAEARDQSQLTLNHADLDDPLIFEKIIERAQAGFALYRPMDGAGQIAPIPPTPFKGTQTTLGDEMLVLASGGNHLRAQTATIVAQHQTPFWRAFGGQPILDLTSKDHFAGGVALNKQGEFLGLVGSEGRLVPAAAIQQIAHHFVAANKENLGWLGIDYRGLTSSEKAALSLDEGGLLITQIDAEGPAFGHLQVGHILTHIDGTPVRTEAQFNHAELFGQETVKLSIAGSAKFDQIELKKSSLYVNNADVLPIKVQSDAYQVTAAHLGDEGIGLQEVFDAQTGRNYAQITRIGAHSTNRMTGLRAGQIVERVDGARISTPQDFMYYLSRSRAAGKSHIAMAVRGHDARLKIIKFSL